MSLIRLVLVALLVSGVATATAQTADKASRTAPRSANPYTAFLPAGVVPDYAYWNAKLAEDARERAAAMTSLQVATVVYDEVEAVGSNGGNDTFDTAEVITGFGTTTDPVLTIRGDIASGINGVPVALTPFPEEDGSIGDASDTELSARKAIVVEGATLGDGAYGTTTGDFDYYAITAPAGLTLRADIDTPVGSLDPTLTVIDAAGVLLGFNDDDDGLDSFVEVVVPAAGTYYVIVAAFSSAPGDFGDPASGSGAASTGLYNLLLALADPDPDMFAFDLQAGDIIGIGEGTASVGEVSLFGPDGVLRMGSRFDLSGIYPIDSPLPGGGSSVATAAVVAPVTGRYRLQVLGEGPYEVGVRGFRPRLETEPGVLRQTLFLDFDGETIDAAALFGGGNASATLSPLSAFLTDWGLTAADEDALIDAIVAVVQEKVLDDLLASSNNPLTGVDILNSRDHADPFGSPGVSRLIVGGTIAELGIGTIGIASSIDPGNFGLEDTGVVLLDLLSLADPSDGNFPNSLNQYAIDPGASKLDFVAQGVGNITAHEAGHFLGLFHTDQFNAVPNIIDQGGNLANSVGVGADGTFGTADDVNVDFVEDEFEAGEGLRGLEDGGNTVAFGLASQAPVAVAETPAIGGLHAYPNPISAGAALRVDSHTAGTRATLYDALGRRAGEAVADAAGAMTLATAGLAPGAYFLRLDAGEASRVVAVTVVR